MNPKTVSSLCVIVASVCAMPAYGLGRIAEVSVVDRATHAVLPVYYALGSYWVAGTPGRRYGLVIRNALGGRVLAVTSVDGVNVVSGETAAVGQTGYVLAPFERCEIDGWRKSDQEVAAFEFTSVGQSYAALTGRPASVGVLGVALFRERPAPPPEPPSLAYNDGRVDAGERAVAAGKAALEPLGARAPAPASSASVAPRAMDMPTLGTGHGEREPSVVTHTEFERAGEHPDEVLKIRYDSFDHLVAMGVIRLPLPRRAQPDAFPGSPLLGYVPDPPR